MRTHLGPENGRSRGPGDGHPRMDLPSERGPPATIVRGFETEEEKVPTEARQISTLQSLGPRPDRIPQQSITI